MSAQKNRRVFMETAALGGAALGLAELGFLSKLPTVTAAEATLDSKLVRFGSGIEPLVQLLEDTPRDQLLEAVAGKIRNGTSYREVLAALLLASVRNVQPRPAVGFKFHAVLVVNSAHLASLASPDEDRWLPIFWALDYFKSQQREEERASGWKMSQVDEARVPPASKARAMFIHAMETWDEEAADAAVASLARTAGANSVFELFCRYGARDYRSIGHKAIFVANSWRTLQCIGWHHAEPVLRSLTFALLNHSGQPNPAESDLSADAPWRRNEGLEKSIRTDWLNGKIDPNATRDLLMTLHGGSNDEAPDLAVELLNRGVSPQSIWDAVFVGAGELLMRRPGIIGLHALTTANAMHYVYRTSRDNSTRRMLLLQNCAFLPMFRQSALDRGKVSDSSIDDLEPVALQNSAPEDAVDEIFADVSGDRQLAAAKVRSFLENGGDARKFINTARRLIFVKGRNAHDYKFSSAVLEDYHHASPEWRDLLLACSVFNLRGSGERENQLVARTRDALRA
jgi:hypothetical protein